MIKRKTKKKVKDDDENYIVEEPHNEGDEKKKLEKQFKSLRARTTVQSLYGSTQSLSLERKGKIRETGFASMLDFPFQKIPGKLPYFVLKNLDTEIMEVALPNGSKLKKYDDEFLNAFKEQFEFKKYPTTTDLSKLIQRTTNTDFMFKINYLMLFANCMIHCDNSSRLKYYVIKNIKSFDIISDFDWPNAVLMVIQENDKETENETEVEKQKLKELIYETIEANFKSALKEKRELKDLLKENMKMHELLYEDEKLELFVKRFKEESTTCLDTNKNQA
ncbi:hypothetical protein Tco_1430915 [Tanacetum coccineum]